MPTIANRPHSALIIIDVQVGVVAAAYQRDAILATIKTLLDKARQAKTQVIWIQHSDDELVRESNEWQLAPELQRFETEALVEKHFGDAFEDTELEAVLAGRNVGRLFIAGAQTDACIRSTIHGALVRGYDTFLIKDAHTTEDFSAWGAPPPEQVIAHTNLYWSFQTAPGRKAGTIAAADVHFMND